MPNPESIDAILAEMRDFAKPLRVGGDLCSNVALPATISVWADRIKAAVKREMDEAAEFINDYLQEIPVYRPPHDWLVRNGYEDTSYQNGVFEMEADHA